MKRTIFTLFFFTLIGSLSAQPWLKDIPAEKRLTNFDSFYLHQKAFNDYWKDKKQVRSNGIKPFRRWEEFMEPRVYPNGKFEPTQLWNEFNKTQARNTKSEGNWTHMGPTIAPTGMNNDIPVGVGRINAIEFHPGDPNTIWIGAPSGGFWKTTDGGENWYQTTDDLPIIGVSALEVDPTNPDIIYMATGDADGRDTYSIGLLKSTDGGETWNTTGLSYNVHDFILVRGILVNPVTPNVVIVATWAGIYKSTDGAETFTNVFSGVNAGFMDLEYKPGDWNVIYASTIGYSEGGVFKSTDGGDTFSQLTGVLPDDNFIRVELAVTAANPEAIYALYCNEYTALKGVYKSLDEGLHWQETFSEDDYNLLGWAFDGSDLGGQGAYDLSLAVSPVDENEIYVGGVNAWKSTDGGYTWDINIHWAGAFGSEYMHADQHIFVYSPEGVLYSGNDGGIYKTLDGEQWIDISNGINILQIYRIGTSVTDENIAATGSQDNGCYLRKHDGEWNSITGGDGMECIIDYEDPDIMYSTSQFGAIYKSEDGGFGFTDISPATNGAWITPYVMHPTDHNTLFAGYGRVYKTTDRGVSWQSISSDIFGNNIRHLTVAPSNPDYIYAGTYENIFRTSDGGSNWDFVGTGLPDLSISYSIVSEDDSQIIWVTLSGYFEGEKVYKSTDGGENWVNYSEGLPNIPANCIIYQNNTNDLLYVGTDLGVYYRDNTMTEWMEFNEGLPNVIVMELEIHYATQRLRAASYGRGLWESPLYDNGTNSPVPSFDISSEIACGNEIIEFTDRSSYSPETWEWVFNPNTVTFVNETNMNSQHPEVQFNEAGQYDVTLTVTNTNGSNSITRESSIIQADILADFRSNVRLTYPGGRVSFSDLTECNPNGWEWIFEPSTVTFIEGTNVNSQNPVVHFDDVGDYSVSLTATNDISNETETKTDYISVGNNYFIDNLEITTCEGYFYDSQGPDNNYNDSENFTITFFPTYSDSKLIFEFTDFKVEEHPSCDYDYLQVFDGPNTSSSMIGEYCGTNSPGTITSTHETGALTFMFYSDGGVTDAGWISLIDCTPTQVNEKLKFASIGIFPNPTKSTFKVEVKGMQTENLEIVIYEMDGKQVLKKNYANVSNEFSTGFDLSNNAKGLYLIEISSGDKVFTEKLILE